MNIPTIRVLGFKTTFHKRATSAEIETREWVKYSPLHDIRTVNEEMVNQLRPPENDIDSDDESLKMGYMKMLWSQIGPAYDAWKKGMDIPLNGIPLSAWAGVTSDEADVFRKAGVRTVEEISEMTEGQMSQIMLPGMRTKKQLAREFLSSRSTTENASKITSLEERNEALQAQLDHMAGIIASMQQGGEAPVPAKRPPGRPRKVDVAEEAA